MATKALVNHPGMWLETAAADSLARFERDHGKQPINSAGRTVGQQQTMIDRWDEGGAANRPPFLYSPARPAASSRHVLGRALDTSNPGAFHTYGAAYGWTFDFAYDVVHFEYHPDKDRHLPATASQAPAFSQGVWNQQDFLNRARGEKLVRDGIRGPKFRAAVTRYQQFLRAGYGYRGGLDGVWGTGTQVAHAKYFTAWSKTHH